MMNAIHIVKPVCSFIIYISAADVFACIGLDRPLSHSHFPTAMSFPLCNYSISLTNFPPLLLTCCFSSSSCCCHQYSFCFLKNRNKDFRVVIKIITLTAEHTPLYELLCWRAEHQFHVQLEPQGNPSDKDNRTE